MSGAEGSGPGGKGAWKIVNPTQEQAESPVDERVRAVASIGTRMDAHITDALRRSGITEQLLHGTYQQEDNPPIDSSPPGLLRNAGTERLPWLRRAVREKVQAVCGADTPAFEGAVPTGEMPSGYEYVGKLIDAVEKVTAGEERVEVLTTPLQVGPDAQVDVRGNDVALLLDAQASDSPYNPPALVIEAPNFPDDITREQAKAHLSALGLSDSSRVVITRAQITNQPTAFGVVLESHLKSSEKTLTYSVVDSEHVRDGVVYTFP